MAGLCVGGNEPPGSLKTNDWLDFRTSSANEKSPLYHYETASIDYSWICNRKTISETPRVLEIQYCRRRSSANDNSAYMCSANDKSALYRYKTASIDYSRICNRKRISEKSRRLEIQYCRRRRNYLFSERVGSHWSSRARHREDWKNIRRQVNSDYNQCDRNKRTIPNCAECEPSEQFHSYAE
ncbi:hypothetical protein ANN_18124 [Periplaneta americana]|uniref:Uncharacterized protein n=1 Tax=Periplaneta americana TaxID=6978 RepID=A0ABQ8SMW8_PERAM|nr:hypothetical protein ANN_18124 [Periplaneta americana]